MANSNKIITFTFEGKTAGLRKAVNSAVQDLQKFARSVQSTARGSSMSSVTESAASSLEKMTRQMDEFATKFKQFNHKNGIPQLREEFEATKEAVSSLVDKYKDLGNMRVTDTSALTDMQQKLESVSELFSSMGNESKTSYKAIGSYSSELQNMNSALNDSIDAFNTSQAAGVQWYTRLESAKKSVKDLKSTFSTLGAFISQSLGKAAGAIDSKLGTNLTGLLQKSKEVKLAFPDIASSIAASFAKAQSAITQTNSDLQKAIFKLRNYSEIQKEAAKNQAAYLRYSTADEKTQKRMKPVKQLTETEIIDQMMAAGKGSGRTGREITKTLQSTLDTVSKIVSKIVSTISSLASKVSSVLKSVGSAIGSTVSKLASFVTQVDFASRGLHTFTNAAKGISGILSSIISSIIDFKISDIFAEATSRSIELVENLNLFTVSMGNAADTAQDFVDRMSEMYGMNPSNLYRYAGYFAQITSAIGLTDEAAAKLSTSMTKMSNDIASLYNLEIEQVVENLGSGLQGLNQAVRKYGIDMRQTTIQQTAYKYGLTENVATMTEANRIILRYLTMVDQMRNAIKQQTTDTAGATKVMGDFARNIETPANQLRIFKEQVQQLATAIGTFFIPVLRAVLPILNGLVAALRTVLTFFAALFGIDASQWGGEISAGASAGAEGIDNIANSAGSAAKAMKNLLAPFDELHILAEDMGSGGGGGGGLDDWGEVDPRLLEALEALQLSLDEVKLKAWEVRDAILEILGLTSEGDLIEGGFLDRLIGDWEAGDYEAIGSEIAKLMNMAIDWANEHITWENLGAGITKALNIITDIFNGWVRDFNWYGFGQIGANLVNIFTHTIETAIDGVEWDMLGYQMSQMINGLFENIEWDTVFVTLSKAFNAVALWLYGFASGLHYEKIADAIVNGINAGIEAFEPEILGAALAKLIKGGVNALEIFVSKLELTSLANKLAAAITRMVETVAGRMGSDLENHWYKLGNTLAEGLGKVVVSLNSVIATWGDMGLTQALFDFIEGAIDGLKAHSEDFKKGIQNILNGIIGFFTSFRERFSVYELTKEFVIWLQEAIAGVHWTELAEDIAGLANDILKGIVDGFKEQKNNKGKDLIDVFFEFVGSMFENFDWENFAYTLTSWAIKLVDGIIEIIGTIDWLGVAIGIAKAIGDAIVNGDMSAITDALVIGITLLLLGVPPMIAVPAALVGAGIIDYIKDGLAGAWDKVTEWFEGAMNWLVGNFKIAIGEMLSWLPGSIGEFGQKLQDEGKQQVRHAFDEWNKTSKEEGEELTRTFSEVAQNSLDAADEKFKELPGVVETHAKESKEALNAQWNEINGNAAMKWGEIRDTITNKSDEAKTNATSNLGQLVSDVFIKWQELQTNTTTTFGAVQTSIQDSLSNPIYNTQAGNLVTLFTSAFGTIENNATASLKSVRDYLSEGRQLAEEMNMTVAGVQSALMLAQIDASNTLKDLNKQKLEAEKTANSIKNSTSSVAAGTPVSTSSSMPNNYLNGLYKPNKMATGGVVTGPTRAIIGEAGYSEAVIPLDNSPQMTQLVRTIADAVNNPRSVNTSTQSQEIVVKVQIGDTEWDTFVYESAQRGATNVGGNPVEVKS